MESDRENVAEDRRIRRKTKEAMDSRWLPEDLISGILSRLPAKSIERFRCVSKAWDEIISRQDFSGARPQLLFAYRDYSPNCVRFFTSPQPRNLDDNSSPLAATSRMAVPSRSGYIEDEYCLMAHIGGLVCFGDFQILQGKLVEELVKIVCNPTTKESFKLRKMDTAKRTKLHTFFGYDPIGRKFKVLSMALNKRGVSAEHQLLTFNTRDLLWRKIKCGRHHCPNHKAICINGVLYYEAAVKRGSKDSMIACFDLRTETYTRFIKYSDAVTSVLNHTTTLVNYYGSLALLTMQGSAYSIKGESTRFVMCLLKGNEWSTEEHDLPTEWQNVIGECHLEFVGFTGADELVLSTSHSPSKVFYVFYYSFKRKTIRRVAIQGMGEKRNYGVYTFLNYVENVTLMEAL